MAHFQQSLHLSPRHATTTTQSSPPVRYSGDSGELENDLAVKPALAYTSVLRRPTHSVDVRSTASNSSVTHRAPSVNLGSEVCKGYIVGDFHALLLKQASPFKTNYFFEPAFVPEKKNEEKGWRGSWDSRYVCSVITVLYYPVFVPDPRSTPSDDMSYTCTQYIQTSLHPLGNHTCFGKQSLSRRFVEAGGARLRGDFSGTWEALIVDALFKA